MIIGSYVPVSGDGMLYGAVKETIANGANALMVYTGPPQNTRRANMDFFRIPEAHELMNEAGICLCNLVVHAPYIINSAVNDHQKRDFAIKFLTSEVQRTHQLGSKVIVVHPGNFLDTDIATGIRNIASVINQVVLNTMQLDVVLALETMTGKGTEVGSNFSELSKIIELVDDKTRVGVCFDTCHVHDAGYDIINNYDGVKAELLSNIPLEYIKVIHLNDSMNDMGARKDRHANVGEGKIGLTTLLKFCCDRDFETIPKILETPYRDGVSPYKDEIELIRKEAQK